jgi:hypothetical protein
LADEFEIMRDSVSTDLTADEQRDIRLVISVGCDRKTAVEYVGRTLEVLYRSMLRDPKFAEAVRRAEAASEMQHMRNVQTASRDPKQWRASVWWLERQSPERYGRRPADMVTPHQLENFLAILATAVMEVVQEADGRERLLARLQEIAESLDGLGPVDDPSDEVPNAATTLPPMTDFDEETGESLDGGQAESGDDHE